MILVIVNRSYYQPNKLTNNEKTRYKRQYTERYHWITKKKKYFIQLIMLDTNDVKKELELRPSWYILIIQNTTRTLVCTILFIID